MTWTNEGNKAIFLPELQERLIEAAPKMFGEIMRQMCYNVFHQMHQQF